MRAADFQRDRVIQLGDPVTMAGTARSGKQCQAHLVSGPDITGDLAAHFAERALYFPEQQ